MYTTAISSEDWHPADVKAALEKKGWSLRRLSFAHGYSANAAVLALRRPYPKMERIIAEAIGLLPSDIWPSRYQLGCSRKKSRRISRTQHIKNDTVAARSNGNLKEVVLP